MLATVIVTSALTTVEVQTNDVLSNNINQNQPVELQTQPQKQPVGLQLPNKFPFSTIPKSALGLQPQPQKEPVGFEFPWAVLGFPGVFAKEDKIQRAYPMNNFNHINYHSSKSYSNHYNYFEHVENVHF